MTTNSTCPDSSCKFRNSFGYCSFNGGCIATNKTVTVEVPTRKEEVPLAETITPDIIRKEFMGLVCDLMIWETPDEDCGNELKTRELFYVQGAYDMADQLIKRLEVKK